MPEKRLAPEVAAAFARRHFFRPVPLRYVITRSGHVQAVPQGWPNRSRGVFAVDSHDLSRT
jgi:hypothetical protein